MDIQRRKGKILKSHYTIYCSGVCHIGKCRNLNQDNYVLDKSFMKLPLHVDNFPTVNVFSLERPLIAGVFDGMGGEEHGEMASLLAAETIAEATIGDKPLEDLLLYCRNANERICTYATENCISSMGTTAAILVFSENEITLCNIGDSKIFRFADGLLEQISVDHIAIAAYGVKPPLSQNLGIPKTEMIIEPYMARGQYNDGDIYLLCSDGLTDMVANEDIACILRENDVDTNIKHLLNAALDNGGKDNITIILCKISKIKRSFFKRIFKLNTEVNRDNDK